MLIEPASNVSVPFAVVIVNLSNTPDKVTFPPKAYTTSLAPAILAIVPEPIQVFPDIFVITN